MKPDCQRVALMNDLNHLREDFPILKKLIYGKPFVYLDNAATTQKPQFVLDKIFEFYTTQNSNIHRGVHYLSEQATAAYESARETVRKFLNGEDVSEIIFTHGTTDSINIIADSFGQAFINQGDEIIVTAMEHHSNFIPWQMLCKRKGAILKVLPVDENGTLIIDRLNELITQKTKLISLTYVSNVLGVINPVEEIVKTAHSFDIPVMIDGAQAVQHFPFDVKAMDCDFFVFSGHKIFAETGIGVLYGKQNWLEKLAPSKFGGGMVNKVEIEESLFADLPLKFEAGTSNFAGAISLKAAIEYISNIGFNDIIAHEKDVFDYAVGKFKELEKTTIYGNVSNRCGMLSFNLDKIHPYDAALIMDKTGVFVRTGTHCAEPLMKHFGINGTIRASFALYNTRDDVDKLVESIKRVQKIMYDGI
jgi:cysteine desulfurase/selenocysteine lyase